VDAHAEDEHREAERHQQRGQRDDGAAARLAGQQQEARDRRAAQPLPDEGSKGAAKKSKSTIER
jgi:hypothetical protein